MIECVSDRAAYFAVLLLSRTVGRPLVGPQGKVRHPLDLSCVVARLEQEGLRRRKKNYFTMEQERKEGVTAEWLTNARQERKESCAALGLK